MDKANSLMMKLAMILEPIGFGIIAFS